MFDRDLVAEKEAANDLCFQNAHILGVYTSYSDALEPSAAAEGNSRNVRHLFTCSLSWHLIDRAERFEHLFTEVQQHFAESEFGWVTTKSIWS